MVKPLLPFLVLFSAFSVAGPAPSLLDQAKRNDPAAQLELAHYYQTTPGEKASDAFYWLQRSADNGNLTAQARLGHAYLDGHGVDQDVAEGMFWLNRAATQGDVDAQYELGQWFESKHATDIALGWYQLAAQRNADAESAYSRLLEIRFNRQRAKQLDQFKALNQLSDDQPLSSPFTWLSKIYLIPAGMLLLTVLLYAAFRLGKQRAENEYDVVEGETLMRQVEDKDAELLKLKKQLQILFRQLKLAQNPPQANVPPSRLEDAKTATAFAMLGFTVDDKLDNRKIKLRYKQLSRLYHPDSKGSEEEMKRLNSALKTVLKIVNK
ncbi:tetratricopeptide repeat protein [Vibrio proteolyticus]|uniref:J domain-containing protein n=1 Tax=Vibrio proteolyticus NBRC 13287 TaxID=1219065 RepID=U3A1C9_VIBPR|nr:tetratricopeptide repeat protein [Vibrio proteolyticus]GAD67495.1 hypothetical protein VPR01S_08_00770 [Vibrio proteolyticus NBRC 13287]